MPISFIGEPIIPLPGTFDITRMSWGEPGLPLGFRWHEKELLIVAVLESGRAFGDCRHGSGERYVRKHLYRVRLADGPIAKLYFERSFGRGRIQRKGRWRLLSLEKKNQT